MLFAMIWQNHFGVSFLKKIRSLAIASILTALLAYNTQQTTSEICLYKRNVRSLWVSWCGTAVLGLDVYMFAVLVSGCCQLLFCSVTNPLRTPGWCLSHLAERSLWGRKFFVLNFSRVLAPQLENLLFTRRDVLKHNLYIYDFSYDYKDQSMSVAQQSLVPQALGEAKTWPSDRSCRVPSWVAPWRVICCALNPAGSVLGADLPFSGPVSSWSEAKRPRASDK